MRACWVQVKIPERGSMEARSYRQPEPSIPAKMKNKESYIMKSVYNKTEVKSWIRQAPKKIITCFMVTVILLTPYVVLIR